MFHLKDLGYSCIKKLLLRCLLFEFYLLLSPTACWITIKLCQVPNHMIEFQLHNTNNSWAIYWLGITEKLGEANRLQLYPPILMTVNEVPDSSHLADLTGQIYRGLIVTTCTSEIVGFFQSTWQVFKTAHWQLLALLYEWVTNSKKIQMINNWPAHKTIVKLKSSWKLSSFHKNS